MTTTPISNKIVDHEAMLEATQLKKVAAFQTILCAACQTQNAGQCVREDGECPVDMVEGAYRRAS
ncbi:MAG: hypothetical protein ACXVI1_12615 [Halobacteriota archaeon]